MNECMRLLKQIVIKENDKFFWIDLDKFKKSSNRRKERTFNHKTRGLNFS